MSDQSDDRTEDPARAVSPAPEGLQDKGDDVYVASQSRLVWWRFTRHRLAVLGLLVTLLIYLSAIFCEFLAPTLQDSHRASYSYAPPQRVHVSFDSGLHLFAYDYRSKANPETLKREFTVDESKRIPLRFLARGDSYKMWGLFEWDRHLFGPVQAGQPFYAFGADEQGRDVFSRIIYGARISMSVGLIGVILSLVLGVFLGGISGYFGGTTDSLIQRGIEFIMSIPQIPRSATRLSRTSGCTRTCRRPRHGTGRSKVFARWESRGRSSGSTRTPFSCPVGCGSAR